MPWRSFSWVLIGFLHCMSPLVHAQIADSLTTPYWQLIKLNNAGHHQDAILHGKRLVAGQPDFSQAYRQLALAYHMAGEHAQGLVYFDSLEQQSPDNPHIHYARALLQQSRGNHDRAAAHLKACIKLHPTYAAAYLPLAEIYHAQNDLQTAEDFVRSVIREDSLNAAAFYGLGCIYSLRNDWPKAADALRKCLTLDPGLVQAYYPLGRAYEKQWDYQRAAEVWENGTRVATQAKQIDEQVVLLAAAANALHILGNWPRAIDYGERALPLARKLSDLKQEAELLSDLSHSYRAVGKTDRAWQYIRQAMAIAEKLKDNEVEENLLGSLSAFYLDQGDPKNALEYGKQALQIARARGDSQAVATHALRIGDAHWMRANLDEAFNYYRRALRTLRAAGDQRRVAYALGKVVTIHREKGETATAIDSFQTAIQMARSISAAPEEMFLLGALARTHGGVGALDQAMHYLKLASALADSLGAVRHIAVYMGNLGAANLVMGNYAKALPYLERALAMDRKLGNSNGVFRHLNNMAHVYEIRGDYLKALELQTEAYAIADTLSLRDYAASVLDNMGIVYKKMGDYQQALLQFEKSQKLYEEIGIKVHLPGLLLNTGTVYEMLNDNDRALQKYEQSLQLAKEISDIQGQVAAMDGIGNILSRLKQYSAALEHLNQALEIATRSGFKGNQIGIYHKLAEIHSEIKELAHARHFYQQALALSEETQTFEFTYMSLGGLAKVAEKEQKHEQALDYYDRAIDLIESVRERLRIASYKTTFMENKIPIYEGAIALLLRQGNYEDAYAYLQRFRARSFVEILSPGPIDITTGISPRRFQQYRRLEQKLRETYKKVGNEYNKQAEHRDEKFIADLESSLQNIRQQHQSLLDEIRLHHPRYAELTGVARPLTLREIQQKVGSTGVSLAEYFVSPELAAVWVINRDGFHCEILATHGAALRENIERLRAPFKAVKEGKITNLALLNFDLNLSQQLYEQLFMPVEKYLPHDTPIAIVPDGILHYLPFEALVTKIETNRADPKVLFSHYENARFLVERYTFSYLPSASILGLERVVAPSRKPAKGQLIAFGKPDFGAFQRYEVEEQDYAPIAARFAIKKGRGLLFAPLSDRDVQEVSEIVHPASIFLGAEATEERFKQEARHYPHIYLSTHAIADETQPMYSLIVLALDDDPTEDGFLHAYEVFNLKLSADLVVLSACETGLGKLSRGEGLIGLTRAFLYAGASSVVVSLWSVDESTMIMMKHFYQGFRAGLSKTEALRQAKLKLLKTRVNNISFAHPFLWAPFVLVGEPF